jgi:hypothetical protein
MWSHRSHNVYTKGALVYAQFGLWPRAQDSFFVSLNKMYSQQHHLAQQQLQQQQQQSQQSQQQQPITPTALAHTPSAASPFVASSSSASAASSSFAQPTRASEIKMWEDEWVRCAKHLNQVTRVCARPLRDARGEIIAHHTNNCLKYFQCIMYVPPHTHQIIFRSNTRNFLFSYREM